MTRNPAGPNDGNDELRAALEPNVACRSLLDACQSGNTDSVKALLDENPVLLENSFQDGFRPIHTAAWHGHLSLLQFLIERGAALETVESSWNYTPLHCAIHTHARPDVIELILKSGANPNHRDCWEQTASEHAAARGEQELAEFIVNFNAER